MSIQSGRKISRISFAVWTSVSIAICVLIFFFSSQSGDSSGRLSMGITRGFFSSVLSDEAVLIIEKIIRKLAHYGIYLALGASVYMAYGSYFKAFAENIPSATSRTVVPVLICFAYSVTDELHQMLVPDRNGAFTDCLLDTVGALSGVMCVMLVLRILRKTSEK